MNPYRALTTRAHVHARTGAAITTSREWRSHVVYLRSLDAQIRHENHARLLDGLIAWMRRRERGRKLSLAPRKKNPWATVPGRCPWFDVAHHGPARVAQTLVLRFAHAPRAHTRDSQRQRTTRRRASEGNSLDL
jgi:hypothetical protein